MTDRFEQQRAATKIKIRDAFMELLKDEPYDDITVREIAEHAEIGYKTYYRHYNDKTALVHEMIQELWDELSQNIALPTSLEATEANVRQLVRVIKENAAIMRAISRTPQREEIFAPILNFGLDEALRLQGIAYAGESEDHKQKQQLVAHYFVHSHFEMLRWWTDNDCNIPEDDLVHLIMRLIVYPIWSLNDEK